MKKKTKLKHVPVVVQLYPQEIHKADLMREVKIDRHRLNRELLSQPARYAFWAALYATVSARVSLLREQLDIMEAKLYIRYAEEGRAKRKTDIKYHVVRNPEFQILRAKLRRWQDSENVLKYAERAFQQRLNVLQSVNANQRREWDSDSPSRRKKEED